MPEDDAIRLFARDVGLDPHVGGHGNVQDALAGAGGSGVALFGAVEGAGVPFDLYETSPLALAAVDAFTPPRGMMTVTVPPFAVGAGGHVIDDILIAYQAFAAPATVDVFADVYLTDAAGTNTLTLATTTIHQYPSGAVAAHTDHVDFTAHAPTIVGVDLSAAGPIVTSAGGGTYQGVVVVGIQLD